VNEQVLRTRMELLGAGPSTADWKDVRGRTAGLLRRRTRLVLALAVAGAILVAAPAFAFVAERIDFWKAEPASPRVRLIFDRLEKGPPHHLPRPGVDAREARKILSREFPGATPGGTWTVWVSPSKNGGFCSFLENELGGGAGCTGPDVPLSVSGNLVDELSPGVLSGSVADEDGAYVEVVRRNGVARVELTWVSEPIDAAFFLAYVPVYGDLRAVILRDAEGEEIARQSF
jgi:hypothetical protein